MVTRLPWMPQPPTWQLDWAAVLQTYPWLQSLAEVPQSPYHHAEGDVLTHTQMVVMALISMPAWLSLPADDRLVLVLAALFHDIGKQQTTIIDSAGQISSPGHARVGAHQSRMWLWDDHEIGVALPYAWRERIAWLVRLHGLPLWFLDHDQLSYTLITASYQVPLTQLALLAEADVRGRISPDQAELLARISLFQSQAEELGCWAQPYPFANSLSRVQYARQLQHDPAYAAYDQSWGEVIVLSGLPGSGKDTWIQQYGADRPQLSLDHLRSELRIAPTEEQGRVIALAKTRAREFLRRRQPFIWNATNLTRQIRDPLISMMLAYHASVQLVYLDAPLRQIMRQNQQRPDAIPEAVLLRLAYKTEPPTLLEAQTLTIHSLTTGAASIPG